MRACVFALAMTAVAQPALASEHHKSSHQISHRHHIAQGRHHHFAGYHRHGVRFARIRREPVGTPAAAAQAFMRTDATESAWTQSAQASSQATWPRATSQQPTWQQPQQPAWQSADSSRLSANVSTNLVERRSARTSVRAHDGALDAMIARHASQNGVPVELVRRVVTRESGYNPRARNAGALGLMQIKYATARSMGYAGSPGGLLDAETNLTYAVKYLAGAYHAAGGNQGRAVALYASGYRGRGVAVARRAPTAAVAETGWGMQPTPVALQTSVVMARRHMYRHRIR
jgi:soluble lytic murein transglycosylase-like protein